MAWWLASPCSKVVSFSKSHACTENYISFLRFGQSCQFGFFRNQGRACLTHVYWPLTEDQERVGHILIRQKTFFLSQLVSKRGSSFTLKIKKERKWLASRVTLILISFEWVIKSFFSWHLFSLPMLDILVLILKKKEKEKKRKIFFPFVVRTGKNLSVKTVLFVLFFFFFCMYNYWG